MTHAWRGVCAICGALGTLAHADEPGTEVSAPADTTDDHAWMPEGAVIDPPRPGDSVRRAGHAGLGLVTGTFLTGMSAKVMASDRDAVQITAGLGWGPFTYWNKPGLGVGLDYLRHFPTLFDHTPVRLGWHLGVGLSARVRPNGDDTSAALGLHGIVGLELLFRDAPVDVALAWRPGAIGGLGTARGVAFAYGDLTVHVRVWFDASELQEDALTP